MMLTMLKLLYFVGSCLGCMVAKRPTKIIGGSGEGLTEEEVTCRPGYYPCTRDLDKIIWNEDLVCCQALHYCFWRNFETLGGCIRYGEYNAGLTDICQKDDQWQKDSDPENLRVCYENHCTEDGACCDEIGSEKWLSGKKCQCPHHRFERCHVCPDCETELDAASFAISTRGRFGSCGETPKTTVFSPVERSSIYKHWWQHPSRTVCHTDHARRWECTHTVGVFDWTCRAISGIHENAKHDMGNGHFYYDFE